MLTENQKSDEPLERQIESLSGKMVEVRKEISKAIVGQDDVVEGVLIALLAGAHVLLEGVPGVGKTLLVRTLAQAVSLKYSRIQFTPDLMPADVIGTSIVQENGEGRKILDFQPGPIFTNSCWRMKSIALRRKPSRRYLKPCRKSRSPSGTLRTCSKNRSSLWPLRILWKWKEPIRCLKRSSTVFYSKSAYRFLSARNCTTFSNVPRSDPSPRCVMSLTGAEIIAMRQVVRAVPLAPHVQDYVVRLVLATHADGDGSALANKYIRYGSSPRGAQALILGGKVRALLNGRFNVSREDIHALLKPALRHRIILNFEAQADGRAADDLLDEISGTISKN